MYNCLFTWKKLDLKKWMNICIVISRAFLQQPNKSKNKIIWNLKLDFIQQKQQSSSGLEIIDRLESSRLTCPRLVYHL